MSSPYIYPSKQQFINIIQITDPHLFADEEKELLGINTQQSFNQVLKEIKASDFSYELILATGDLTQEDTSKEAYLRFCESIKTLDKPLFWIPGNHDYQPDMYEELNQKHGNIFSEKEILLGDHWQMILLDSQVAGSAYGELGKHKLEGLKKHLSQHQDRFSLIVLHHHILPTHSAWLDQHNLRDTSDFLEVLQQFPNVKGIMYGHIHQAQDLILNQIQVMATPSTCIQFKPDSNKFALDMLQPGWREITLHNDGRIETQVKRIQEKEFLPNMLSEGY